MLLIKVAILAAFLTSWLIPGWIASAATRHAPDNSRAAAYDGARAVAVWVQIALDTLLALAMWVLWDA